MLLIELFDNGGDMMNQMRASILDFITPLMSNDVPFITVQQVIDALKHTKFGISVDRSLVMKLLDPDEVKSIGKIEGDRIYFDEPEATAREVDQQDEEKDKKQVQNVAQQQAQKSLAQPNTPPPQPNAPQ